MADLDRKIKTTLNRASHYLLEIQNHSKDVLALSNKTKFIASSFEESELTIKKVEIFKTEIKEKLKQFALNIEEVYKVIDKKINLLAIEVNKEHMNATAKFNQKKQFSLKNENQHLQVHDRELTNNSNKIKQLEEIVAYFTKNEVILGKKLEESKLKNEKLLQQFDSLSIASNNKINQLQTQLKNSQNNNVPERKKIFAFEEDSYSEKSPLKSANTSQKVNLLGNNKNNYIRAVEEQHSFVEQRSLVEQHSYASSNSQYYNYNLSDKKEENTKNNLSFGCIPVALSGENNKIKLDKLELVKNVSSPQNDQSQKLDRNRRYEYLMLNLLEGQQSTEVSNSMESNKPETGVFSTFSKEVVKRYQV